MDGRVTVRIGRRTPALDRILRELGASEASLVTAANPHSARRAEAWNRRMNRALAERLAALPTLPAQGRLGAWREDGFLVCAPAPRMRRLGRLFRQNALVALRRGRPAAIAPLR